MRSLRALIILFLACATRADAQPYYFNRYDVRNGLSNNTVLCCKQDKKGFMWFGTKDGISRFDGYHFKTYDLRPNGQFYPFSNNVMSLAIDSSGLLWVGSARGLYQYDSVRESFIPMFDSLYNIETILPSLSDQLLLVANKTIYQYKKNTHELSRVFSPGKIAATDIIKVDNSLFVATDSGDIYKLDDVLHPVRSYHLFDQAPAGDLRWITRIVSDGHNGIFAATLVGVKHLDCASGACKDIIRYDLDKATLFVHDILGVSPGKFWFGSESGIFIYTETDGKLVNLRTNPLNHYSLSDNPVYTVYKDNEGGVWAGTYFGGLNYYPGRSVTPYEKYLPDASPGSIGGSVVREICQDRQGILWVGTEDGGLNRLDPSTNKFQIFDPNGKPGSISYFNIHGLLALGDTLWIGTHRHGLDLMNLRLGKVIRHYSAIPEKGALKSNFILDILGTAKGDICLATNTSVLRYEKTSGTFLPFPSLADKGPFLCIIEDHAGMIWACSYYNGLFCLDPNTGATRLFYPVRNQPNTLSVGNINTITEDTRHFLWIGTDGGGLCRLSPDRRTFQNYTTANGLPSNIVMKILEDNRGKIWISTLKGLVSVDSADSISNAYADAYGPFTEQFNFNSGFRDDKGRLYFGTTHGMIAIQPDSITPGRFSPRVFITALQVDNKDLPIAKNGPLRQSPLIMDKVSLSHDQSTFSIDFAAVNFQIPRQITYRYFMEGLDKKWTLLNQNRRVYFTGLRPGVYTFIVEARGSSIAGINSCRLVIEILPPIWASWQAYRLYALVTGLLVWYGWRLYYKRQLYKKEKDLYAAKVEFFTHVAHEIRTPLTLIRGPMENLMDIIDEMPAVRPNVLAMERNTDRLLRLVDQLLDFEQTESKGFRLDFKQVNASQLLTTVWKSFETAALSKKMTCTIEMPENEIFLQADGEALQKIFSNLIGNAIKYGEARLYIRLSAMEKDKGLLIMEVGNDGLLVPPDMAEKIFEPFRRLSGPFAGKGSGVGLAIARSLTVLHRGKLYLKSPENGMNVFELILPLQ
jgi:signal transduction histidine kinase/ligand-binding sensor domain-containing protein